MLYLYRYCENNKKNRSPNAKSKPYLDGEANLSHEKLILQIKIVLTLTPLLRVPA